MDWLYALEAAILGIVEGLTEFLPISSTGHLIIAGRLLHFDETSGADTFYIAIQAGAILAVCWYYRKRIIAILRHLFIRGKEQRLAVNTVVGFLPAAVLGALLASQIKHYLFNIYVVSLALVVGGFLILWIENRQKRTGHIPRIQSMDDLTWKDALGVGFMQCLAMIPGTSRSGATIIGGMVLGLSRKAATEFSFFLSIPTIFGATAYDLYKNRDVLAQASLPDIGIGALVSFLCALVVIKWLLHYVSTNDFRGFGWYRIVFGLVFLGCGLVFHL